MLRVDKIETCSSYLAMFVYGENIDTNYIAAT
jgi:hypothetical protein